MPETHDTIPQGENRIYEISFLVVPTVAEETLPKHVGEIKEVAEQFATEFISEEYPKLTELAYTMEHDKSGKKFDRAYFGWMKFVLPPEQIEALDGALSAREDIIRHLIVRTVRENTVATKRSYKNETLKRKAAQEESAEVGEIDEAEVDKKIDELVDENETA